MPIFVNHKAIETFNFSGGECHVKVLPSDISDCTDITAYLYSSNDVMRLLLTVDAIRRIAPQTSIHLTIPYFPYARQDRVCNEGEALSVKVMANLINSLYCTHVTLYDPHSDVTPALVNNCNIINSAEIIANSPLAAIIKDKDLTLLSPDAGAEKKVRAVAKRLKTTELLCASKTRETATGEITSTQIHGDISGKNIIIIDDICDGGRTFIELAKALKDANAGDVYLYITHGIFSQGLSTLEGYFKHIYCHHTFLKKDHITNSQLTILGE